MSHSQRLSLISLVLKCKIVNHINIFFLCNSKTYYTSAILFDPSVHIRTFRFILNGWKRYYSTYKGSFTFAFTASAQESWGIVVHCVKSPSYVILYSASWKISRKTKSTYTHSQWPISSPAPGFVFWKRWQRGVQMTGPSLAANLFTNLFPR